MKERFELLEKAILSMVEDKKKTAEIMSGVAKDSYLYQKRNLAHKFPACDSIRQNYPKKRKTHLFFG